MKKILSYFGLSAVLGMLLFSNAWAEEPKQITFQPVTTNADSLRKEELHPYDHFLFISHDTLYMASITPEGFKIKEVYTKQNLSIGFIPLCVTRGKIYALKLRDLICIDIATGECTQIAADVEPFTYDSDKFYYLCRQPEGTTLRVYDFKRDLHRDVVPFLKWEPSPIAISPDHKKLAYYEGSPGDSQSWGLSFFLTVLDLETQKCSRREITYLSPVLASVLYYPPFAWVDHETIVIVHTRVPLRRGTGYQDRVIDEMVKQGEYAHIVGIFNVNTGKMTDIGNLPGEPGLSWVNLERWGEKSYFIHVTGGARNYAIDSRYRIDPQENRLIESDVLTGKFRWRKEKEVEGLCLYFGQKLLGKTTWEKYVSIAPDESAIVWVDARKASLELFYYDTRTQTIRTVIKNPLFGESFLWFTDGDL